MAGFFAFFRFLGGATGTNGETAGFESTGGAADSDVTDDVPTGKLSKLLPWQSQKISSQ